MPEPGAEFLEIDPEALQPVEDVDVEADVSRVGPAPHGVSLTDAERAAAERR